PMEFLGAAESFRHLANDFVMDVEHNWVTSGLKSHDRSGEDVARGRLHDVLDQRAVPLIDIGPATLRIVLEAQRARALEFSRHHLRFRIGNAAAARQRQPQRAVLHLPRDPIFLGFDLLPGDDGLVRGTFEALPEIGCRRMCPPEIVPEALDPRVSVSVAAIKLAPSAEAATEAEGEIIGLAEVASGFVLGSDLSLERSGGHDTVG